MHLYSNSLSAIAIIPSSNIPEVFLACFSYSNNFKLSQSSLRSDDKILFFRKVAFCETMQHQKSLYLVI